jgi:hypothetical protein
VDVVFNALGVVIVAQSRDLIDPQAVRLQFRNDEMGGVSRVIRSN